MRHSWLKLGLVGVLALMFSSTSRATWRKLNVSPATTEACAIAVDSAGHPHIVLQGITRSGEYALAHAWHDGKHGHGEIIDSGEVGWWSSIAVDAQDHLHVSYHAELPQGSLKYAYFDGTSWSSAIVDAGGFSTSITVDSSSHPHISYSDGSTALKYAHFNGSEWQIETVPGGGLYFGKTSIALTPAGVVHISSSDSSLPRRLFWTSNVSGEWETEYIGDGRASSLSLDSSGHPHIAYFDEATLALKLASFDGLDWATQTLDTGAIDSPSLALDANGRGHISYGSTPSSGSSGAESLKYAAQDGADWPIVTVDRSRSGLYSSLALDPLGLPNIAFLHAVGRSSTSVKYARKTLPDLTGIWMDLAASGQNLESTLQLTNRGTEPSRPFRVAFYLSDDSEYGPADTPVGKAKNVPQLGVGRTKSLRFSAKTDQSLSGRYLIARIDSNEKVEEATEANNTATVGIP